MEYTQTNRERNQQADRGRMQVSGRGLLTIAQREVKLSREAEKQIRQARKRAR